MPVADENRLPWEAAFVENMRRARQELQLSQTELAKRVAGYGLPFHQQTIQRIEQGERPVRLNEVVVIAEVMSMGPIEKAIQPSSLEKAQEYLGVVSDRLAIELRSVARWAAQSRETVISFAALVRQSFAEYQSAGGATTSDDKVVSALLATRESALRGAGEMDAALLEVIKVVKHSEEA